MFIIGLMGGHYSGHFDLSRRELLKRIAGWTAGMPFATLHPLFSAPVSREQARRPISIVGPGVFSERDDSLLEALEALNFLYFWEQANPDTGLVRDRCNVRTLEKSDLGSIAATGFGLTALCIAVKRGYISFVEARSRALTTLRFLWEKLPHHRGFFYHWNNINTGERLWDSEVSSIDTAILLCGVLTCRAHFQHTEISQLAYEIFNRADWNWLSEDTAILPHGWRPESGFL
jgi:hypothetical protein